MFKFTLLTVFFSCGIIKYIVNRFTINRLTINLPRKEPEEIMKFLKDEMLRDGTKLWWKIRDVEHKHMVNITAILSKYNLYPTQPRILGVILRMDGATQKEIAEEIQTSPSALAMSIKRLQKAQLIEKTFDEKDLRTNKIVVTPKGKKIHDESLEEIIKEDCRMLENFTPEEVSKLMSFLDRIYDNIGKDS